MNINYDYFFTVELLHKYFADGTCNDFSITPSILTQAALNGNKMLAKQYGSKLFVGLQTQTDDTGQDTGQAFITPSVNAQFTFFMQLNNPAFFNYTNLPFTYSPGKVYYFTNRNNNTGNTKNFLSQFVPYDNSKTYHPGDLAPNASGLMFQCVGTCTGISPGTNSAKWMQVDTNVNTNRYRYTSESDALQWMPSVSTYVFGTPQMNAVIDVFGFDTTTKDFTDHIIVAKTILFSQSTGSFKLDLSKLSPGRYKLTVNGVTQMVYINDELSSKPVFAVIDIFNDSSVAATYQLLNGSILLKPVYSVIFLNRATIWKYVLKSGSMGIITLVTPGSVPNSPPDEPPDPDFPATAANTIISNAPIPLSEAPLKLGLALSTIDNKTKSPKLDIFNIACASPDKLTTTPKGIDTYACSEIFLNY